jgi:two-component system OmpR family response regulator
MKLLLVDDDATLASALRRGLMAEGFSVEVAVDGTEGLWRGREGSYDLILLDIMLPGVHGYRVCAELRRAGVRTPILMLTAKDGDLDEAEALDGPAGSGDRGRGAARTRRGQPARQCRPTCPQRRHRHPRGR